MGKLLYTVVCRYYTINGIIEIDLYEVFRRLRISPYRHPHYGLTWDHYSVIRYHVYSGLAVQYVIKKVLRDIDINEETRHFYSIHSPYSLLYDCKYDLKDVEIMNRQSIDIRMRMTDDEFYKVYGNKNYILNKEGGN